MNLAQLVRKARYEVDAIRAGGATSGLWQDEEVNDAVNTAVDAAYTLLRLADSEVVTKSVRSTDSAVDLISESYNPTSLAITSGTSDYTLPPDLVSLVTLIPITSGYTDIRFAPARATQRSFQDLRSWLNTDTVSSRNSLDTYSYLIFGARTLRVVPTPRDTYDVELIYRFRPPRLQTYSTGAIVLTQGSTAASGAGGTTWVSSGLRTPIEVVRGTASDVLLNAYYPRVSSLTDDGNLVLSRAYPIVGTGTSGAAYLLSMVPQLPEEHHAWLASMTAALMLRKVNLELSNASRMALEKQFTEGVQTEFTTRMAQESVPAEPYELP